MRLISNSRLGPYSGQVSLISDCAHIWEQLLEERVDSGGGVLGNVRIYHSSQEVFVGVARY